MQVGLNRNPIKLKKVSTLQALKKREIAKCKWDFARNPTPLPFALLFNFSAG